MNFVELSELEAEGHDGAASKERPRHQRSFLDPSDAGGAGHGGDGGEAGAEEGWSLAEDEAYDSASDADYEHLGDSSTDGSDAGDDAE